MITTAQFKNGMYIEIDGIIFNIQGFQHVKPGKGGAFVRTKLKNARTGAVLDKTFRAGEKVNQVIVEDRKMRYLYRNADTFVMMDEENFDEFYLSETHLSEQIAFLKEGMVISVSICEGEILGAELPIFAEYEIVNTEPGLRGDTVKAGNKPATLETGAIVNVPLFVNAGDKIKIDTRKREYVSRV